MGLAVEFDEYGCAIRVAPIRCEGDGARHNFAVEIERFQRIDEALAGHIAAALFERPRHRHCGRQAVGHERPWLAVGIILLVEREPLLLLRTISQIVERRAIVEVFKRSIIADILREGCRDRYSLNGLRQRNFRQAVFRIFLCD